MLYIYNQLFLVKNLFHLIEQAASSIFSLKMHPKVPSLLLESILGCSIFHTINFDATTNSAEILNLCFQILRSSDLSD